MNGYPILCEKGGNMPCYLYNSQRCLMKAEQKFDTKNKQAHIVSPF
ncbi:hypothetical protein J32TS6_39980 [Virgibacillus pantothenticus]|nr:hypothetical protein J32TS6_39980 [Virgibacillus pantothenticus]